MNSRPTQCYLLFDERMALHRPPALSKRKYPDEETDMVPCENSSRIICLYQKMMELQDRLRNNNQNHRRRFVPLDPKPCDRATIELAHSPEHYDNILLTSQLSNRQLQDLTIDDDLYYCRDTFLAASLACGGVVNCVDAVMQSHDTGVGPTRAIALVRPPGHHATRDQAMGFCYFNNIAVAAKHAIHTKQADRVFILDWDIHHGNGIQDITYDDPNIFYLSIHRASFGKSYASQKDWFYPGTGRHDEVGQGRGTGSNLNIVWGKGGMGNTEYAAAFAEVVLPVLKSFDPDLIIIACGLDAAAGDLLGDCGLSSDMYYIMTKSLLETAGTDIPLVVALEGGYDLDTISSCMESVALALLDEPWIDVPRVQGDKVWGFSSIMDAGRHECTVLNQKYSLSRYWTHKELSVDIQKKGKTKRAISSIKKSARALANKGTCLGCTHFPAIDKCTKPRGHDDPLSKPKGPHCHFCAAENWNPYILRNHRPYQDKCYPFKKRRFGTELEAASELLALGQFRNDRTSPCLPVA